MKATSAPMSLQAALAADTAAGCARNAISIRSLGYVIYIVRFIFLNAKNSCWIF
jgi:hypothetical protein